MSTQGPRAIDNDLYQLYTDIQLRDVENDATMSLSEKEQLTAILMSFREIDGNVSYPIFQEIFQNSTRHRTGNDQEPLVAYTQPIEREILDTAITESVTVVPESHQTDNLTIEHTPRVKSTSKATRVGPVTTRSQVSRNENHAASIDNHLEHVEYHSSPSTGEHKQRIENHATVNDTLSSVNKILARQSRGFYIKSHKYKNSITSFVNMKATSIVEKRLDQILLPSPRKELQFIKDQPQRSCAVFRARMNTVNEPKTAEEKAFLETFDVRDVMQVYKKPMNDFISLLSLGYCKSPINKCRKMLCAYQIGKITDQLLRASPHDDKEKLETSLFRHLNAAITKNRMIYCSFTSLCVNSLYLVEHVGVHALFVPEVISSDTLKKMDKLKLMSLAKHLNDEWPPQFKKLARLTYYGEVVVSRSHSDDTTSENHEAYPGHFLNTI